MDPRDLFRPIHEATIQGAITARHAEKLSIEAAIARYCPDGVEASEMLSAFAPCLEKHYGADRCTEVLLYLSMAKNALERLDNGYQVDAREALEALEAQAAANAKRMP
jgi:hypothetical protein